MYPVKSCGLKGEIEFAKVLRPDVTGHRVTLEYFRHSTKILWIWGF